MSFSAKSPNSVRLLANVCEILYNITMEFDGVKDIAIYGTDCVVDISRGNDYAAHFISAREKYFDLAVDDGTLTVRQKIAQYILQDHSAQVRVQAHSSQKLQG